MRISEVFYSIQGEGELTGVPSVFIRTSGCNLRCVWCDTPYASWNPEGDDMTIGHIVAEVEKHPTHHVVLTGGEPMIAKGIHELARQLKEQGKHITIETAGTISPDGIACDLASISPKLANSTPQEGSIEPAWIERHEQTRKQPKVLQEWVSSYDFQFKFVLSSHLEIQEIEDLVKTIGVSIPSWKVQLMPEGVDSLKLEKTRSVLVDICRKKGYRFTDRLHVHLFGNTRGT
jgi:7-carboxy-7-deazaguanine synthase